MRRQSDSGIPLITGLLRTFLQFKMNLRYTPINMDHIDISQKDIDNANSLLEMKQTGGREIVLDTGAKIILGLPDLSANNTFEPPDIPHVFEADRTLVREGRKNGKVAEAIKRGIVEVVNT